MHIYMLDNYTHPLKGAGKKKEKKEAMGSQFVIQLRVYLILLLSVLKVEVAQADHDAPILAQPGCNDTCGDVLIPFPFGIGANCSLDHWFEIECRASPNSNGFNKPFLSKFNIEVMEVSVRTILSHVKVSIPPLNSCSADTHQQLNGTDLRGSPYNYSAQDNAFVMEGCPGSAVLFNQSKEIMAGCGTVCSSNNSDIPPNSCYGIHCCQTLLPSERFSFYSPLQFYQIDFNGQSSGGHQNCSVATLIESEALNQYYVGMLSSPNPPLGFPVVLLWSWMSNLQPDNPRGRCYRSTHNRLYCYCKDGYYGNPYLSNGCQVPRECKDCQGYCSGIWNITGHLLFPDSYYCEKKPLLKLAAILGLSISFGIVLLVISIYGLYRVIRRRREMKKRAKFFKRNGGLLLQQQLSSNEGVVERSGIFSISELDKATDHFNANRILGQGGQGTVYKGMLADGRIVAIKKAKLLDESQLEQFINEVVILSQINHRNVVKLLGCCLETEVPLLVYEFIPNGTLSEHIHDPDEDFVISWETCLKIAADSAAAVSYLHSSSSIPIFHRDIKSSNILLDEKYRAKVSDFGSSKTIAIDQTHMTTLVQGTMGYLDPEYFHSYQFTEKSDVYSFGVVLLELLTGKKPIYRVGSTMEQKNLVTEFLFLSENSRLSDILDPKIMGEAKEEELFSVVELARRCISWSGKLRPTMKEVAMTLEMIMKFPAQVSRWFQEQEALPVPDAGFDEYDMADVSDAEFTSRTFPAGASSPSYTDVHPLLPETKSFSIEK